MQQDNDPKLAANSTMETIEKKRWQTLFAPPIQSPDFNAVDACISLAQEESEGRTPSQ